jgi:hypothetical protein
MNLALDQEPVRMAVLGLEAVGLAGSETAKPSRQRGSRDEGATQGAAAIACEISREMLVVPTATGALLWPAWRAISCSPLLRRVAAPLHAEIEAGQLLLKMRDRHVGLRDAGKAALRILQAPGNAQQPKPPSSVMHRRSDEHAGPRVVAQLPECTVRVRRDAALFTTSAAGLLRPWASRMRRLSSARPPGARRRAPVMRHGLQNHVDRDQVRGNGPGQAFGQVLAGNLRAPPDGVAAGLQRQGSQHAQHQGQQRVAQQGHPSSLRRGMVMS